MEQDSAGMVLTLISQNPKEEGKFIVNDIALKHICQFQGKYCFISICGDYRSGKSFLLNSLFVENSGFQTSPTTQSCTKGIRLWSKPILHNGVNVWIVDTEGFGSIEKDSTHDGKIFLMNLLISNIVLYNSFGAIDQNSISKLAMICREARTINQSLGQTKLFWVLRDFSLQIINKEGKTLSPDQYLEECLKESGHHQNKNQKEFLRNLFKERHCVPLIRPVIDEEKLSNLKQINKIYLRQEFKVEINHFHKMILQSVESKAINGIAINSQNIQMYVNEFVKAVNSQQIDCNLNCTYEKIQEYQQTLIKENILKQLRYKIDSMAKLLPVSTEHINYLKTEIKTIIKEQLKQVKSFETESNFMELMIGNQVSVDVIDLQRLNREKIQDQIKQYMHRHFIELYPKFITLQVAGFQSKFNQIIAKYKEDFKHKFNIYADNQRIVDHTYNQFIEKELKKVFAEIAKRWRNNIRQIEEKAEEARKNKKQLEEQNKKLKEEKLNYTRTVEESKKDQDKDIIRAKQDAQACFREEVNIISNEYQATLAQNTINFQYQIKTIKDELQLLKQSSSNRETEYHYEKQSLLEKIALQKQKGQLAVIKLEQTKNALQGQLEQAKNSYQNRIRILQIKGNDMQAYLSNERKKFQMLSEERKIQEAELLEDIAQKNQKILQLNEQLVHLEDKYKTELQKILLQEKQIIYKTLNSKIVDYEYKLRIYEAKTLEYAEAAQERKYYQRRAEELEIQIREVKAIVEEERDQANLLSSKIKKLQHQVQEKDDIIHSIKNNHQKEINLITETLNNNTKYIQQIEERHKEELEYVRAKAEQQIKQEQADSNQRNQQIIRQNRGLLQLKFDKQRMQLKQIIKNNYDQIENLKIGKVTITTEMQHMYCILLRIKQKHQNIGLSLNQASDQSVDNSYNLVDIAESPEQDTDKVECSFKQEQVQFVSEEIQEIFQSMNRQIKILAQERVQAKQDVKNGIAELEQYETAIAKVKHQNKYLKAEVDEAKRKVANLELKTVNLELIQKDYQVSKSKQQATDKELTNCKRELQIRQQLSVNREQNIKENISMYRQTIDSLTLQNQHLHDSIIQLNQKTYHLEEELSRFNYWAIEVKAKEQEVHQNNHTAADNSVQKIKELQNQIKKLAKKLQEQKISKLQKESKKQGSVFSEVINQNRVNQIDQLRRQNQQLYSQLQAIHSKQLREMQDKKQNKTKMIQYQEQRYMSLKEEFQQYKRKSKQILANIQRQLEMEVQAKNQIKKEYMDIENNILKKYQFNQKLMHQEIDSLKKEKHILIETNTKRVTALQEHLHLKANECDRKVAEQELKLDSYRQEMEKEHNRIVLEGERHRLKYEHLLKVNGELIKQVQSLKSKAHQITLKQKYKQKISNLFKD